MVNKMQETRPVVCTLETMTYANVPWLNKISATGLAIAVACLAYAGFLHMFENESLSAFVAACAGGFTLGRMWRSQSLASSSRRDA